MSQNPAAEPVDTLVLGASGYVGGETLRLLAGHPGLRLRAAVSARLAGERLADAFPHLALGWPDATFVAPDDVASRVAGEGRLAIFSALPHGAAAGRIAALVDEVRTRGRDPFVVDMSADFRLGDAASFEEVYGVPHGAPELTAEFLCAPPDVTRETPRRFVAHPGCFTTAVTLAARPLVAAGLIRRGLFASCITGSTGSGASPSATTHHPYRHANVRAYKPLDHRHAFEMERLVGAPVAFVPHSGPFARGIHATVTGELSRTVDATEVRELLETFYAASPFVTVTGAPPALKDVVGTNAARLGVAVKDERVVVFAVIDNLTKGAAGGAVQWMNRMLGQDEASGLALCGTGWS